MTESQRTFDWALNTLVKPELAELGFVFNGRRDFIYAFDDGDTWTINFQPGLRHLQGKFTVNLSVLKAGAQAPVLERLGAVRTSRYTRMVCRLFSSPRSFWRHLLGPGDLWWRMSPFEFEARPVFESVISLIRKDGIAWFEAQTEEVAATSRQHG